MVCKTIRIFLIIYCLVSLPGITLHAQDQRIADSLTRIYEADLLQGVEKLELLRNLSYNENRDLDLAMGYAEELIAASQKANEPLYQYRGHRQLGQINMQLGNFEIALDNYFRALEIARELEYTQGEGSALTGIADTYSELGNSRNATNYYNQAIILLRNSRDTLDLGIAILNAGDEYFKVEKHDSALTYFAESGRLFDQMQFTVGMAYARGNQGMVYAETGNYDLAQQYINEAVAILTELEDSYAISEYLTYMADSFWEQGDSKLGLEYAHRSLDMALQFGIKQQISDTNLKLSQFYEELGDVQESLKHFKEHVAYRDSVNNLATVQRMADLRTDYEVSQKQVEVDLLNQQKRNQLIILASVGVLAAVLLWFFVAIRKEKKKSDTLLLNILPEKIAKELKEKGQVESVRFENVTVLFTDFVQFSKIAAEADAKQLVQSLDYYFRMFDAITASYGLEKIKTIGDAYMCAAGLPSPDPQHVRNTIMAAREMTARVQESLEQTNDLIRFQIRVGIHSGPVIAGIVGTKKFQYDIWGDTVNIAARMESNSEPGRINISETTYEAIREEFDCSYRGEISVKNRGELKMYFLD